MVIVCRTCCRRGAYICNTPMQYLRRNKTKIRNIVLAGAADRDGECKSRDYLDQTRSWKGVYASGVAKIIVQDYDTEVKLNKNKIVLNSNITCTLNDNKCNDYDGGYVFWKSRSQR